MATKFDPRSGRLLIIDPGLKLWGSERALLATIESLATDWGKVVVVAPENSELAETLRLYPVEVERAPIGNLHRRGLVAKLVALTKLAVAIRKHKISHIYLNQAGLCHLVNLLGKLFGINQVIHVRLAQDVPRCHRLKGSKRSGIDLIFVSNSLFDLYPAGPERHKRLTVCYDPYAPPSSAPHLGAKVHDFACVGRLCADKQQRQLLDAFAMVGRSHPDSKLHFFGAGVEGDSYASELMEYVHRLQLSDRVHFHGFRLDMANTLPAFRVVVVPSLYESLGRVVMEAWAAGAVPIASSRSGGCAELLKQSGGGLLYEGYAPESIANAMLRALALGLQESERMVRNGVAWTEAYLSLHRYQAALAGVLYRLSDNTERPTKSETEPGSEASCR